MELLYADDLVLETKELLLEKVRKWNEGMEKNGLRVNAGKTKIMWCIAWVRLRILESIHVVFAGRELAQLNLLRGV